MQPGSLAVRPHHGNFFYAETQAPRQKQNLRIEAPALNSLKWKDALRRLPAKGLEAALRIDKVQAEKDSQNQIVDSSKQLPIERLPRGLQIGTQPARADRNVGPGRNRVK